MLTDEHIKAEYQRWGTARLDGFSEAARAIESAAAAPLLEQIAQLEQQLAEARNGLAEVEVLIGESYGVAGLHLNGDVAPWSDLREGGHFEEWLLGFDVAIAQVNAKGGEA